MRTEIIHKIPQGKLVRLFLDFDTTHLLSIKICGDFFIHPEETVIEMERLLTHLSIESSTSRVKMLLDRAVDTHHAQLIGVDTQTLSQLICEAINP